MWDHHWPGWIPVCLWQFGQSHPSILNTTTLLHGDHHGNKFIDTNIYHCVVTVYVTDHYNYNHRNQMFSQNGTFLRTFGRHGSGPARELSQPWSISVDHGYVYVIEWGYHCVLVLYTSGEFITSLAGGAVEENWNTHVGSLFTSCDSYTSTVVFWTYLHLVQITMTENSFFFGLFH